MTLRSSTKLSRREFARLSAAAAAVTAGYSPLLAAASGDAAARPLAQFGYGDVTVDSTLHQAQLQNTHEVLMNLSEDSLLKPFRQMAGQSAPGEDLGGWYNYDPDFNWHSDDSGFAPGATFGQWVSALARYYAISGSQPARAKVLRLNRLYAGTISGDFYDKNRFPAYCYDKLVLGLIDSHQLAGDGAAFALLDRTTHAALPHLPPAAVDRELQWRPGKDQSYRWDESYTMPENLFLAYRRGAGRRYRDLAVRYLDDATWFDPLARDENVLATRHAYSYVNSLSSAMQAYLTLGSEKHLRAARNAFVMLSAQSYPTGGWGPDEKLAAPDAARALRESDLHAQQLRDPLRRLRALQADALPAARDARLALRRQHGAHRCTTPCWARNPCAPTGVPSTTRTTIFAGRKVYSNHRFPCCSGTLPQVAADYGINSYLRDPAGVYVNLYLPSSVRWVQGGAHCSLQQSGEYPFADTVSIRLGASQLQEFALRLRIPAWAGGARIEVNGQPWSGAIEPGSFAAVARRWRDGDRVELELPRRLQLQSIDRQHPDTVALSCGPLVLFAISAGGERPRPRRAELLLARQVAQRRWEASVAGAAVTLLPYVAIDEEEYSTFLTLAG